MTVTPPVSSALDPRIATVLGQLDRAFDRRSWHGSNLMGALRRVSPDVARWRPAPERHNVWETVVHCAYWKYRLCRHLAAEPPASFSFPGSDWWVRPGPDDAGDARRAADPAAWRADLTLLREWHGRLLDAVAAFDPDRLHEQATAEWTYFDLATGGAAHDLYHAGQVQLLKRMRGGAR